MALGPSEVVFGGSWVASTADVVRSGYGTQRNPAQPSAPQRESTATQVRPTLKTIVSGIDSSRSAYNSIKIIIIILILLLFISITLLLRFKKVVVFFVVGSGEYWSPLILSLGM